MNQYYRFLTFIYWTIVSRAIHLMCEHVTKTNKRFVKNHTSRNTIRNNRIEHIRETMNQYNAKNRSTKYLEWWSDAGREERARRAPGGEWAAVLLQANTWGRGRVFFCPSGAEWTAVNLGLSTLLQRRQTNSDGLMDDVLGKAEPRVER